MRREVHHETAFRAREEAKNERANAQARGRNEEEREKTRPPAARCDSIFVVASRNVGRAAFVVVSYRIVSFRFVCASLVSRELLHNTALTDEKN